MKKMGFEKYIGFNLYVSDYDNLRNEAFDKHMTVSGLLREMVRERYQQA